MAPCAFLAGAAAHHHPIGLFGFFRIDGKIAPIVSATAASTREMPRCVLKRDIDNVRDHEQFVNGSMNALFARHTALAA